MAAAGGDNNGSLRRVSVRWFQIPLGAADGDNLGGVVTGGLEPLAISSGRAAKAAVGGALHSTEASGHDGGGCCGMALH